MQCFLCQRDLELYTKMSLKHKLVLKLLRVSIRCLGDSLKWDPKFREGICFFPNPATFRFLGSSLKIKTNYHANKTHKIEFHCWLTGINQDEATSDAKYCPTYCVCYLHSLSSSFPLPLHTGFIEYGQITEEFLLCNQKHEHRMKIIITSHANLNMSGNIGEGKNNQEKKTNHWEKEEINKLEKWGIQKSGNVFLQLYQLLKLKYKAKEAYSEPMTVKSLST